MEVTRHGKEKEIGITERQSLRYLDRALFGVDSSYVYCNGNRWPDLSNQMKYKSPWQDWQLVFLTFVLITLILVVAGRY